MAGKSGVYRLFTLALPSFSPELHVPLCACSSPPGVSKPSALLVSGRNTLLQTRHAELGCAVSAQVCFHGRTTQKHPPVSSPQVTGVGPELPGRSPCSCEEGHSLAPTAWLTLRSQQLQEEEMETTLHCRGSLSAKEQLIPETAAEAFQGQRRTEIN